jgi:hypothetical protein
MSRHRKNFLRQVTTIQEETTPTMEIGRCPVAPFHRLR